jgi:hypothetical protein
MGDQAILSNINERKTLYKVELPGTLWDIKPYSQI